MARIEGVNLPPNKRVEYGLTYVFGIGLYSSQNILKKCKIDFNTRVRELSDNDVVAIQKAIAAEYKTEGDLRREITQNIRRLQEVGSYRGIRHKKGLPVRGQRSKTNARTRKGPRKAGSQITLKKAVGKK